MNYPLVLYHLSKTHWIIYTKFTYAVECSKIQNKYFYNMNQYICRKGACPWNRILKGANKTGTSVRLVPFLHKIYA